MWLNIWKKPYCGLETFVLKMTQGGTAVLDVYVVHLQLKKSLDFGDNGEESLGRVHLIDFVHPLGLVVHLNLVDLHELGKSEDQRVVVPQPAGGGAPRSPPWGSRSH